MALLVALGHAAPAPRARAVVRRAVHRRGGPAAARRDPRRRSSTATATTSLPGGRAAVLQRAVLRGRPRLDVAARPRRRHLAAGAVAAGDRRRAGADHPRGHPAGRAAPPASSPGWSSPRSPLLLEQAVEARSYGLAVLATGGAFARARPLAAGATARSAPVRPRRRRDGAGALVRGHRAGRLRRRRAACCAAGGRCRCCSSAAAAALPTCCSSG